MGRGRCGEGVPGAFSGCGEFGLRSKLSQAVMDLKAPKRIKGNPQVAFLQLLPMVMAARQFP